MTVFALWGKAAALSFLQVAIRVRTGRYARPENARMMGHEPEREDERIARLGLAWRNEAEATPIFIALAFAYLICGGPAGPMTILCVVFVAGRYGHGWAEFRLLQPHRTIAFLAGFAASATMAVLVLRSFLEGLS